MDKSIPFFTTDASLGKSILTSDDPEVFDKKQNKTIFKEINDSSPISIWSIANIYEINPVYVVEDSFVSFVSHYKYAKKLKKQLIFGCKFKIVTDSNDTTEESLKTESNVVVWMKNNKGYEDLIKLYSAIHSDQNKYYWDRFNMIGYNRGDWKMLQKYL